MRNPKILVFDIETAPNLGYTWGKYEQNVIQFKDDWYILCFAAKWLGEKKVITSKLTDFKIFNEDKKDDFQVVKELWKLLDEADVVIAHNGDKYDIKKSNARFIYHGLPAPSSYQSIDTLKLAKKYFGFSSNKLDDLGKFFKIGKKVEHEGFELWLKCMIGDKTAWKHMIKYNIQDIILLEKLYYKFLPWITNHPNLGLYQGKMCACPNCGSTNLMKNGLRYNKTTVHQRWRCKECFANSQSVRSEKIDKPEVKN